MVRPIETHRSIAGCPPSEGEIAAVLNIATKEERTALLSGAKLRAT
jgi:coenzyme F420-reducing hydrogenase gamma subunit